jgi:dihydrodipicolinate synthase/N-acetylneuraminate lyase
MLAEGLALGATGCLSGHANVIPYLLRSMGHHLAKGNLGEGGAALGQLFRLNRAVAGFGLEGTRALWSARWLKAAMAALGLPGSSEGRMRPPYRSPTTVEIESLAALLHSIDLPRSEADARRTLSS